MVDSAAEPSLTNRTSPRWMHWINLIGNILVVLGAGWLFQFLIRWQPETTNNPVLRQIPGRAVYHLAYACGFLALMALIGAIDSIFVFARYVLKNNKNEHTDLAGGMYVNP